MEAKGFRAYKEQAVCTMTQEEQLLLLYDELVKRLTRAELALDKADYPTFEASVDRSTAIVEYLNAILDHRYPISRDLARLYEFMTYELGRVKIGRNRTELERVKTMASEFRDTFREAGKNANNTGK
jgi:flagellar protein FliS